MYRQLLKELVPFALLALLPLIEMALPAGYEVTDSVRTILILSLLGLGVHVVTGCTGLLNLGSAAFMAIGAYAYAITTAQIYPFQWGFIGGIVAAIGAGCASGALLGLPAVRLRGDYLAIVTLGFGEIVQDLLRNLDYLTKGTQGINPLPYPWGLSGQSPRAWFYFLLAFVAATYCAVYLFQNSRWGRSLLAIREDELAARSVGVPIAQRKLLSCAVGASCCACAGGLWAAYFSSTGDPGNYDFNLSVMALCMVIVGGIGQLRGVVLGAFVIVGINSIVLAKLGTFLARIGLSSTTNVYASPTNWKYMIFGLALVLVMKYRPQGIAGTSRHQQGARRA